MMRPASKGRTVGVGGICCSNQPGGAGLRNTVMGLGTRPPPARNTYIRQALDRPQITLCCDSISRSPFLSKEFLAS